MQFAKLTVGKGALPDMLALLERQAPREFLNCFLFPNGTRVRDRKWSCQHMCWTNMTRLPGVIALNSYRSIPHTSIVGVDSTANHYDENQRQCYLRRRGRSAVRGPNGSWPDAGAKVSVWRVGRSASGGRTIHVCIGTTEFTGSAWILLPRGTLSGWEILAFILGSAGQTRRL